MDWSLSVIVFVTNKKNQRTNRPRWHLSNRSNTNLWDRWWFPSTYLKDALIEIPSWDRTFIYYNPVSGQNVHPQGYYQSKLLVWSTRLVVLYGFVCGGDFYSHAGNKITKIKKRFKALKQGVLHSIRWIFQYHQYVIIIFWYNEFQDNTVLNPVYSSDKILTNQKETFLKSTVFITTNTWY